MDAGTFVRHVAFPWSWVGPGVQISGTSGSSGGGASEMPDAFSFESAGGSWSGTVGVGTSSNATNGSTSLEITECGYQVVSSPVFQSQDLPGVGDELDLDIFVPSQVENPYWVGSIEVKALVDGQNYSLGTVNLTSLSRGEWNTVSLGVGSAAFQALSGDSSAQIQLIVNTSVCQESILVDNLRWGGTITLGERFIGENKADEGCSIGSMNAKSAPASRLWFGLLGMSIIYSMSRRRRRVS